MAGFGDGAPSDGEGPARGSGAGGPVAILYARAYGGPKLPVGWIAVSG
jgi:hypothetical protein